MPGPLLSVSIYGAINRGVKGGISAVVGHAIIEAITAVALLVGLKQFLVYANVQGVIGIAGGIILIWMGINMLRNRGELNLEAKDAKLSRTYVFQGMFATLSNPYWYIWWATVGLNYISISTKKGIYGFPAFYFGHISSDFIWYGIISYLLARGVKKISPKIYNSIVIVLGCFLIFMGISFIVFGVSKLFAIRT